MPLHCLVLRRLSQGRRWSSWTISIPAMVLLMCSAPGARAAAGDDRDCTSDVRTLDDAPTADPDTSTSPATESARPPQADQGSAADPSAAQPSTRRPETDAEDGPSSAAAAMGRTPARVKCLDQSLVDEFGRERARKGVQTRPFRKARRVQIAVGGGLFAGDLTDTNWQVGGDIAFWLSEEFGFDGQFRLTPQTLRVERSATGFSGQDRYPDGMVDNFSYTALGHLLWAPMHTKLRSNEQRIVHGDFVLFAGAGPTFHDTTRGVGFDLGVRLYLYPLPWLSLRLDVSDHILAQETLGSRRISNNLVFSTGVGLWIPFSR